MGGYDLAWNLDSLYEGGSGSPSFEKLLRRCAEGIDACDAEIASLPPAPGEAWVRAAIMLQNLSALLWEATDFAECLEAQDVADSVAGQLTSRIDRMNARRSVLQTLLATRFLTAGDDGWRSFLEDRRLAGVAFFLNEQREIARLKMDPEREVLADELATDGYHAWGRMYEKIAGRLRVRFPDHGEEQILSMGQIHNKMEDPDRSVRKEAFAKMEEAWNEVAELTAMTLNHQAGFRLSLYGRRGWDSVLDEPLRINRLGRETLETMWGVVADESRKLLPYMEAKARLLGIDRLAWYDVTAPVGKTNRKFTYDEAAGFIRTHFAGFSEDLAGFSRAAFEQRWIEAEDRPGKRAGGFCTDFPLEGETRIFMTFGGTYGGVSTLGHELGHAYHTWLLRDRPFWTTQYPMTLAETASTFCETIISDAALDAASSDEERLALLAIQSEEALIMMMNLRARFVFETSFFDERRKKSLTADELNGLMLRAQKQCFCDGLDPEGYHPLFWASKLHFYITTMPFYNFPYVFGYLFSNGIYERAVAEGPAFAKQYEALLGDTGTMTCEKLASKHLGVDLTRPDFWAAAVHRTLESPRRFVELAAKA